MALSSVYMISPYLMMVSMAKKKNSVDGVIMEQCAYICPVNVIIK